MIFGSNDLIFWPVSSDAVGGQTEIKCSYLWASLEPLVNKATMAVFHLQFCIKAPLSIKAEMNIRIGFEGCQKDAGDTVDEGMA